MDTNKCEKVEAKDDEITSRLSNDYDFICHLSNGSKYKYCLGEHKLTLVKHVIKYKKIKLDESLTMEEDDKMLNEIKLVDNLRHENILNYKFSWLENNCQKFMDMELEGSHVFVAMEYCLKGNLNKWLVDNYDSSSKKTLIKMMQQIACGLDYLHTKNLVHCNLNPKNIFVNGINIVKIGEFDSAIELNESKTTEKSFIYSDEDRRSNPFLSPEQIDKGPISEKVDIYASGIILLKLLYPSMDITHLFKENEIKFPALFEKENHAEVILIRVCLDMDPKKRISAKNLLLSLDGLEYRTSLPAILPEGFAEWDEKTPFPYIDDKATKLNHLLCDDKLKQCRSLLGQFTESITPDEVNCILELMQDDQWNILSSLIPKSFEFTWKNVKRLMNLYGLKSMTLNDLDLD